MFKMFITKLKAGDTFADLATISTSVTITVTVSSLVVILLTKGTTCVLTISIKLFYEKNSVTIKHQKQLLRAQ